MNRKVRASSPICAIATDHRLLRVVFIRNLHGHSMTAVRGVAFARRGQTLKIRCANGAHLACPTLRHRVACAALGGIDTLLPFGFDATKAAPLPRIAQAFAGERPRLHASCQSPPVYTNHKCRNARGEPCNSQRALR